MSNEPISEREPGPKRTYRKRRRAESEAETRRRITQAAVDLHGTIGPARTTMKAVAERAGVQRATLYRHFPDEFALFGACSAHWADGHPMPEIRPWSEIADPSERLVEALAELYDYYAGAEPMLTNVIRDAPLVEALQPTLVPVIEWLEAATDVLLRGRRERGRRRKRVRAAIGHALAFGTWSSLVRGQGLEQSEAVALMAGLAAGAANE